MAKGLKVHWSFIEVLYVHMLGVRCFGITLVIVTPVVCGYWIPHFFIVQLLKQHGSIDLLTSYLGG